MVGADKSTSEPSGASWAVRVAAVVNRLVSTEMREYPGWLETCVVRATSSTAVEVVYRLAVESHARGLRLDARSAQEGPELFQDRTPEELGFYLAHTGVLEPADLTGFSAVDDAGVAWMDAATWMRSVAG